MRPFPAVRALIVAGAGLLLVTLTPTTAAACDASYGTKPTVSFGSDSLFGGTCSTGTSVAGAIVVALLAVAALVFLARLAFRKGEEAAASWAAMSPSDLAAGSGPGLTSGAALNQDPASVHPGPEGPRPQAPAVDVALARYLNSVGLRDDTTPPQPTAAQSTSPRPTSPQPFPPPDHPQ